MTPLPVIREVKSRTRSDDWKWYHTSNSNTGSDLVSPESLTKIGIKAVHTFTWRQRQQWVFVLKRFKAWLHLGKDFITPCYETRRCWLHVLAQIATQPVSNLAGRFPSRPACFQMGWPNSSLVKTNGLLQKWLGGWHQNFLGQLRNWLRQAGRLQNCLAQRRNWLGQAGQFQNPLLRANSVVTGQLIGQSWNWLGGYQAVLAWYKPGQPTCTCQWFELLGTLLQRIVCCFKALHEQNSKMCKWPDYRISHMYTCTL